MYSHVYISSALRRVFTYFVASQRVEVGQPCCEYCILNSNAELFPPPPAPSQLFREAIASDNWQPLTRVVVILKGSVYRAQVILLVVDLYVVLCDIISYNIPPCACSVAGKHRCVAQEDKCWCGCQYAGSLTPVRREACLKTLSLSTVIPRRTKIIRSGITFVSRNFSLSRT